MKRSKQQVLEDIRRRVSILPGMNVTIGQPISHRIDHMLSGTRAAIAHSVESPSPGESVRSFKWSDTVRTIVGARSRQRWGRTSCAGTCSKCDGSIE